MIDISNLTSLITAFRQETEQGSISPETLGALLQAIANQLQSATTDQEQSKLTNIYNNLLKMGNCLTNLAQGDTDRNNVLGDYTFYNVVSGIPSAQRGQVLIKQATTERAGAMRAQQVIDLNAAKKGVATLEDAVAQINTQLEELNGYIESTDGVVQTLADDMYNAKSNLNTLNNRVSVVPIRRGVITIDPSSITSPIGNYFKYSMADGYYEIVRGGMLIGRAISFQFGNFRVFDVVGLCHINSNTFVYQDSLAHILVRVAQNGLIVTNGTIDHVDLQNQINLKQDRLEAGNGISISGNKISVSSYPAPSYIIEFASSDGVFSGNFEPERYRELHHAIVEGKTIIVQNGVTFTTAVSTAIGEDYIVIRYSIPRIQQDNATVVLGVYELTVNERSYTSKSVFKVLPPA